MSNISEEAVFGTNNAYPDPPADLSFDDEQEADGTTVVEPDIADVAQPVGETTSEVPEQAQDNAVQPDAEEAPLEESSAQADDAEDAAKQEAAEESAAEENETALEETDDTPAWVDDYATLLNEHFQNLRAYVRQIKVKDESILKLSNELQKYREGYCSKVFKSIGMEVIMYRESCRKALADIAKFQYDAEKVKKYLGFLVDEYTEMLSGVGVEEGENGWLYNGRPIKQTEEEQAPRFVNPFEEIQAGELPSLEMPMVKTADDLLGFLKAAEDGVQAIVRNNDVLDKCLQAYIDFSFYVEKDLARSDVLPFIRSLVTVGDKLGKMVDESCAEMTEENGNVLYAKCLSYAVYALEFVLLRGGISIDDDLRDTFDAKKDRVMTRIDTDDETLDRRIAAVHTDCYVMNDKVIYPSRVDVYKFAPQPQINE